MKSNNSGIKKKNLAMLRGFLSGGLTKKRCEWFKFLS